MTNINYVVGHQYTLDSIRRFNLFLKERIQDVLEAEIFSLEEYTKTNKICRILDFSAGIDYLVVDNDGNVRGLASRIQPSDRNWRTFTVRNKRESGLDTELVKRQRALEEDYLYPYWVLQAYVGQSVNEHGEKLLGFAITKTADLLQMVGRGLCMKKHTGADQYGQADFYVCRWDDVKNNGYYLHEE